MDDCELPVVAKGLCRKHYNRMRRTGDPEGVRRFYAPTAECAADCCSNPVKLHRRPRKYCSPACYHASGHAERIWADKMCDHCGEPYTPRSPKQRWCWTCLGEPITDGAGARRYPGGRLLKLYDVSAPEWDAMRARHDGRCWICRDRPAEVLDHCHGTGKPRGALCGRCNTRLHREVDSGWLTSAIEYLGTTAETAVAF